MERVHNRWNIATKSLTLVHDMTLVLGVFVVFGRICTVAGVFHQIDQDGNESLDKAEFELFCTRMDMALSVQQRQELWAAFDSDQSGTISLSEFEDLLIDVKAHQHLHSAVATEPDELCKLAAQLQEYLGDRVAETTLVRLFGFALDKRLSIANKGSGMIQLWEFRAALRKTHDEVLSPYKKSNLLNVFGQLFRRLDTDRTNHARCDDVTFFIRSCMAKFHEITKKTDGLSQSEQKQRLMVRVGNVLWENAERNTQTKTVNGKQPTKETREAAIYEHFDLMLQKVDKEKRGHVTKTSFVKLFKLLDFNLTVNQEACIFEAIDTDHSGTIEHIEFLTFLRYAKKMMDKKALEETERADPRNFHMLVEAILRDVSSDPYIMEPILMNIKNALAGIGS